MGGRFSNVLLLATAAAIAAVGAARADCEEDLTQLGQALKAPGLTAAGKAALDEARKQAVSALKKDDDATCHKVIADALPKAGLTLK